MCEEATWLVESSKQRGKLELSLWLLECTMTGHKIIYKDINFYRYLYIE